MIKRPAEEIGDNMKESILNSIKHMLGVPSDYYNFDTDIIIHINSVFAVLHQVSELLPADFRITGPNETWSDYIGNAAVAEFVRTFVYLRVRMLFDPPTGAVLDALKDQIRELEWRLSIAGNLGDTAEPQSDTEEDENADDFDEDLDGFPSETVGG